MIYKIRINRKVKNIKVYKILKKTGEKPNIITMLFMKMLGVDKKSSDEMKV